MANTEIETRQLLFDTALALLPAVAGENMKSLHGSHNSAKRKEMCQRALEWAKDFSETVSEIPIP